MKQVMIVLLIMLPVLGFGQIEKGSWLMGGTASFSSTKNDVATKRKTHLELATKVGGFLTKNIAVGLDVSLVSEKKYTAIGFSPFARYYLNKNYLQAKYITFNSFGSRSNTGYDVAIGRAFFVKSNVAFEPELYYQRLDGAFSHDDYGIRLGFQFYF